MKLINEEILEIVQSDIWRNRFHIQAPTGLLNDPNGLIYHKGVYHVFYQWHPNAPVHGMKYWNHVVSNDLVRWSQDSRIIEPKSKFNAQGAYSGSAWIIDDKIKLYYTGNTRDESGERHPFQLVSEMDEFEIKEPELIIDGIPSGYTDHFRDPKVFMDQNTYYMIIGAQTTDLKGSALIYTSSNGKNWRFAYPLKIDIKDTSYMWECPDIVRFDDRDVLLYCPQGSMDTPKLATNLYPSAYLIGNFSVETGTFSAIHNPQYVDYGFDFYAPQTFVDAYGKHVLIAWLGMAEIDYPSDKNMWAHVLSIPRVLSVKNNHLYQLPHPNLESLRSEVASLGDSFETYELRVSKITNSIEIKLYAHDDESLKLSYDATTMCLSLDRGQFKNTFGSEHGTVRSLILREPLEDICVYRDTSTVEIFINQGAYTMSARFFPQIIAGNVIIEPTDLTVQIFKLEDVNHDL